MSTSSPKWSRKSARRASGVRNAALAAFAIALVAACGGGGGGDLSSAPVAPPGSLNWGPPVTVESSIAPGKLGASVDPNGLATLLWNGAATSGAVFLPRVSQSATGDSWATPVTLETTPASLQSFTLSLVSAGASSVAAWLNQDSQAEPVIRVSTFSSSWSTPLTLQSVGIVNGEVDFAGNAAGAIASTWVETNGSGSYRLVGLRRAAASSWPAPVVVQPSAQLGDKGTYSPSVAIDPNGTVVAVWEQGAAGAPARIFAARLPAGASVWEVPVQIDNALGTSARPRVVATAPGRFVAAWEQTINGRTSIYGSAYGSTGWQQNPQLLENDDRGDAGRISMAPALSGGALVTWMQSDGNSFTVWAHRYTGTTWTTGQPIVAAVGGIDRALPQVAIDGAGNAIVIMEASQPQLAPPRLEYSHLRAGTTTWTAPTAVSPGTIYLGQSYAFAMNASGTAVVAWIEPSSGGAVALVARLLRP